MLLKEKIRFLSSETGNKNQNLEHLSVMEQSDTVRNQLKRIKSISNAERMNQLERLNNHLILSLMMTKSFMPTPSLAIE